MQLYFLDALRRLQFQSQRTLQCSECPIDLQQLLVSIGDILGRQAFIAGAQQVLAVELPVFSDHGLVDAKLSGLQLFEITPHESMGQQALPGFFPMAFGKLFKGGELGLDAFQISFAGVEIMPGLFRVVGDDETPPSSSFAGMHRLDVEVCADHLETASPPG